jgi:hypothetical protein
MRGSDRAEARFGISAFFLPPCSINSPADGAVWRTSMDDPPIFPRGSKAGSFAGSLAFVGCHHAVSFTPIESIYVWAPSCGRCGAVLDGLQVCSPHCCEHMARSPAECCRSATDPVVAVPQLRPRSRNPTDDLDLPTHTSTRMTTRYRCNPVFRPRLRLDSNRRGGSATVPRASKPIRPVPAACSRMIAGNCPNP